MGELEKVDISLACKAVMDLIGSGSDDEQQENSKRKILLYLLETLEADAEE